MTVPMTRPSRPAGADDGGEPGHDRVGDGGAGPAPAPFALLGAADRAALPADVVDAFPLTPGQLAVLRGGAARPVLCGRRVTPQGRGGPITADDLRRAAQRLAHRYEALRTTVDLTGCSIPVQRVHHAATVPITVHGLPEAPQPGADARLTWLLDPARHELPDPAAGPLLRLHALAGPEGSWLLLAAAHPALAEVLSLDAVLGELLADARRSATGGCGAGRSAADGGQAGGTIGHAACVDPGRHADPAGRAHWQGVVHGHGPVQLPTAWRGDDAGAGEDLTVGFADLLAGLHRLATAARVPLRSVLLAAHLKVLATLTPEPAVRTDVALRPHADVAAGECCEGVLHRIVRPLAVPRAATWRLLTVAAAQEEARAWRHRHAAPQMRRAAARDGGEPALRVLFEADGVGTAGLGDSDGSPAVPLQPAPGYGVHVTADGAALRLRVAAGGISPDAARTLAELYRVALQEMASDPDGDARRACLPPHQRADALHRWGAGPAAPARPGTVVDRLRAQAAATPDAVAVRTPDAVLTYRDLEVRSNRIAHHLLALGARPDALVGVCLRRSVDLVPALVGVWKAGAGYLPLDPALPADRVRRMLTDTGCPIVVSTTDVVPLPAVPASSDLVLLDDEADAIAARPATAPDATIGPDQLAYVIYTSGSTGAPKGVMVQHDGLLNYLAWTVDAYAAHGDGGAPVFSSISFDLGIPDLFTPLITGQPAYLLPEPFDAADLGPRLLDAAPYSFVKLTPGHLDLLTHQLTAQQVRDLAGIVIAAGDSFTAGLAARWLELAGPGGTRVATEYGPTEITIGNSGQEITRPPDTELVPLGVPIPGTTMYILDSRLEPVAVGVPGEVYIGGIGVSRGYLGRPALTAERFLPDPFGPPGSRLYRSGDLARWLPDGSMDFLGRLDNQVKIRGYRVELGEVQAVLSRRPDVRDAVVVARDAPGGGKRLVAYLVAAPRRAVDVPALRAELATLLPDYMVPAAFLTVERIPLTSNGKVDTRALPEVL